MADKRSKRVRQDGAQEKVLLCLNKDLLERIDANHIRDHYESRSEWMRQAFREKLQRDDQLVGRINIPLIEYTEAPTDA